MATKLILESRAFSSPCRHSKYLLALHKFPKSITFQCRSQKTPTLLYQKTFHLNPTTTSHKYEIIVSEITPSFEINGNTKQENKTSNNQINAILDAISSFLRALKMPMTTVLLACVLMVLHGHGYAAWGASGGVMGGSSFSSSSDSSSSYGSSSSSSYSSSSSDSYSYPSRSSSSSPRREMTEEEVKELWRFISVLIVFILAIVIFVNYQNDRELTAKETNSIVKIQVGVLGTAKSLQTDLNKIALTANTSTPKGISYVLTETILALLRHPDYFISAYSSVNTKKRHLAGEELFRKISIEERAKFDEETLVNLNNTKKQSKISKEATGFQNEFIVVTIVAAVKGALKLPTIKGSVDLKEALEKLGSIPYHETIAAEVLWTPQAENDTLSEQELLKDYPLLKPLVDDMQT